MPSVPQEISQVLALRQRESEARKAGERDLEVTFKDVTTARDAIGKALDTYLLKINLAQRSLKKSTQDFLRSHQAGSSEAETQKTADDLSQYKAHITIQSRMVGAIHQALKRASAMDRVLENARRDNKARYQVENQKMIQAASRKAAKDVHLRVLPSSEQDDLELLYGDGELENGS